MPEIKSIASGKLLCLEGKGDRQQLASLFESLQDYIQQRKITVKKDRLAIIYDPPLPGSFMPVHFSAAYELACETTGDGEVIVVIQASNLVASEIHHGSYQNISEVYQQLEAWIKAQGYQAAGPSREIYLSGHLGETPDAVTEIQIPVIKTSSLSTAEEEAV